LKLIDLTGERYGRLVVLERAPNDGRRTMWRCVCDCGTEVVVRAENLRSGNTKSCGCYKIDHPARFKHGYAHTRLAGTLARMKNRCYNPKNYEYANYGGRGITICDEWLNDSTSFYEWAVNNGYDDSLTIDRIDNDLGYSPENCRWANVYEQANNKRNNTRITFNGETHTIAEWGRIVGINANLLYARRSALGWDTERMLTTPVAK